MQRIPHILMLAAALALSACGPREWSITVRPDTSPAAGATSEPQFTGSGERVILSWVERDGQTSRLKFSERMQSGWTTPMVAASGDDWFLSYADVPTVFKMSDGTLVAEYLKATEPTIEAYDLQLSYSKDNGKTWSAPFTPHHDGTLTQHGFGSLVETQAGLGLVWLDGRAAELDTTSAEGGAMSIRYAAFDRSWKQTADAAVDVKVCECCPTTAAVTTDGVITAFRDRSDKEIRDIAVSRLDNGAWTASTPVHNDNWELFACPVNGPMLSAQGRTVAVAWFTAKGEQGQAYAAFSSDAGRTWGNPIRLDDQGSLGRVDIQLLADGSAVAAWVEFVDGRSEFRVRRVESSGMKSAPFTVSDTGEGRASGYPRIAIRGNDLVFAWTQSTGEGTQTVKTAIAALP